MCVKRIRSITLTVVLLASIACGGPQQGPSEPPPPPVPILSPASDGMPLALIEAILVAGQRVDEVSQEQAVVIRSGSGELVAGSSGLALFANDQIKSAGDVIVIVLFLDIPAEKDNRVTLDPGGLVQILKEDSILVRLGRVFGEFQGAFNVVLRRFRLIVRGTEVEVIAMPNDEVGATVLEGDFDYVEGDFSNLIGQAPSLREPALPFGSLQPIAIQAAFSKPSDPGLAKTPHWIDVSAEPVAAGSVQSLEEIRLIPGGAARKERASREAIQAKVDRTNEIILARQPSYSARNVIPHFNSGDERRDALRKFRFDAIWNKQPGSESNKMLGDVYSDWGNGAKAIRAYKNDAVLNASRSASADFLADLGEAYRMTGRLDVAEEQLRQAVSIDRENPRVFNARGNLLLAQAIVARDEADAVKEQGDRRRAAQLIRDADGRLHGARSDYQRSLAVSRGPGDQQRRAVIQSNIGDVYLGYGDLQQLADRPREAGTRYRVAERQFEDARNVGGDDLRYPFAKTGLGEALRRQGVAAEAQGEQETAKSLYLRAEEENKRAIERNPDLAEAFVNLGKIYEARGPEFYSTAKEHYKRAIKLRPKEAGPRFRFGAIQLKENPGGTASTKSGDSAGDNLQVFMRLEPSVSKKGVRTYETERLLAGKQPAGAIPNLIGQSQESAAVALARQNLKVGQVTQRPDCDNVGRVISQKPAPQDKPSQAGTVDIVVGSVGTNPTQVPKVAGLRQVDAESAIQKAGLRVARTSSEESNARPGSVVRTKPEAGTRLARGCQVELVLAKSRTGGTGESSTQDQSLVIVPQVEKLSVNEAIQALAKSGLSYVRLGQGRYVRSQSPKAGSRVRRGTKVNITLGAPSR